MTEQGSTAWDMTVSRRFDTPAEANSAVDSLKSAGFRDDQIRVWQHKDAPLSNEDRIERPFEGFLAGGVIGGLIGLLVSISVMWAEGESISEETTAAAAVIGAAVGAVLVTILVLILSRRFSFGHHGHHGMPYGSSVVTVTAGDKEAEAKRVFDGLGS